MLASDKRETLYLAAALNDQRPSYAAGHAFLRHGRKEVWTSLLCLPLAAVSVMDIERERNDGIKGNL